MKYIDAERLKAEIERRMEMHRKLSANGYIIDPNRLDEDEDILSFVHSLQQEQPEVDLEKELDSLITPELKKHKALPSLMDVACHFYELGLNTRKEE